MGRQRYLYAMLLLIFLLAGCYLASGERVTSEDASTEEGGQISGEFVHADGTTQREITVGQPAIPVQIEASASVEWGELTLEFLSPDGSPALLVEARYGRAAEGIGSLTTDDNGQVRYRVVTREARGGTYLIQYRLQPIPTPTPLPTP